MFQKNVRNHLIRFFFINFYKLHIFTNFSDRPDEFPTKEIRNEFVRFITILSNVTYENFEDIPMNNTFGIASEDYMKLFYNLTVRFDPEISSGTSSKLFMVDTITELGFCHSVNTKIAGYNSYT